MNINSIKTHLLLKEIVLGITAFYLGSICDDTSAVLESFTPSCEQNRNLTEERTSLSVGERALHFQDKEKMRIAVDIGKRRFSLSEFFPYLKEIDNRFDWQKKSRSMSLSSEEEANRIVIENLQKSLEQKKEILQREKRKVLRGFTLWVLNREKEFLKIILQIEKEMMDDTESKKEEKKEIREGVESEMEKLLPLLIKKNEDNESLLIEKFEAIKKIEEMKSRLEHIKKRV